MLDVGASAGVVKRSLSDISYKAGFTWQLNAELSKKWPVIAEKKPAPADAKQWEGVAEKKKLLET